MPTSVLRNVPEDLYMRLKETAAEHRGSMTQEAIVRLGAALDGRADASARPDLDATLDWLRREVWSLPSIERRDDDAILGYNADGHFD